MIFKSSWIRGSCRELVNVLPWKRAAEVCGLGRSRAPRAWRAKRARSPGPTPCRMSRPSRGRAPRVRRTRARVRVQNMHAPVPVQRLGRLRTCPDVGLAPASGRSSSSKRPQRHRRVRPRTRTRTGAHGINARAWQVRRAFWRHALCSVLWV